MLNLCYLEDVLELLKEHEEHPREVLPDLRKSQTLVSPAKRALRKKETS